MAVTKREKPASGPHVVVCGFPSSGNNLIERLLRHHKIPADHRHYGCGWVDNATHAIMPLRNPAFSKASCAKKYRERNAFAGPLQYPSIDAAWDDHLMRTLRTAAFLRIPILPVVYEELGDADRAEAIGRRIADFVGFAWSGWPEAIVLTNDDRWAPWYTPPRPNEPWVW